MERYFEKFANAAAKAAGSSPAFLLCVAAVILCGASGPFFDFSENWQLVINTGTTIVTFLMVFLIQNTQNRDSVALQTKLDELILSSQAHNEYVGLERLTDQELEALHAKCRAAADSAQAAFNRTLAKRELRGSRKQASG